MAVDPSALTSKTTARRFPGNETSLGQSLGTANPRTVLDYLIDSPFDLPDTSTVVNTDVFDRDVFVLVNFTAATHVAIGAGAVSSNSNMLYTAGMHRLFVRKDHRISMLLSVGTGAKAYVEVFDQE